MSILSFAATVTGITAVAHGVVAEHAHVALGAAHEPGDDADERALARPVGAQQPVEPAIRHGEGQPLERVGAVVVDLGEVGDVERVGAAVLHARTVARRAAP